MIRNWKNNLLCELKQWSIMHNFFFSCILYNTIYITFSKRILMYAAYQFLSFTINHHHLQMEGTVCQLFFALLDEDIISKSTFTIAIEETKSCKDIDIYMYEGWFQLVC